jgi:c-di-GMP-related signal transduction protein
VTSTRGKITGIRYVHGDFFNKPRLFRRWEVTATHRNSMRLLRTILQDPLDLAQIESIVRDALQAAKA